jgi:hypothetical protein
VEQLLIKLRKGVVVELKTREREETREEGRRSGAGRRGSQAEEYGGGGGGGRRGGDEKNDGRPSRGFDQDFDECLGERDLSPTSSSWSTVRFHSRVSPLLWKMLSLLRTWTT